MDKLEEKIINYNILYRAGIPEISDDEYDALLEQHKDTHSEEDHYLLKTLLFEPKGDFKHTCIMGSFDKIKAECPEDLEKYKSSCNASDEVCMSSKIDGLSLILYYFDGILTHAVTRGDGVYGKSKLDKAKLINIPKFLLNKKGWFVCRGEVTLTYKSFEQLKSIDGKKEYKNLRNTSVGLINSDSVDPSRISLLNFFAYKIYRDDSKEYPDYFSQMEELRSLSFETPFYTKPVKIDSLNNNDLNELYELCLLNEEFDIDGIVIQHNTILEDNVAFPKYSMAYKFNKMQANNVKINSITWQISKSGYLCPVANIEPTNLGGATISNLTLFNYENVVKNKLGKDAIISIQKSGDVIPYMTALISPSPYPEDIKVCPYCGQPLIKEGVEIRCVNTACKAQTVKQLFYFLNNLGIEGISEVSLSNWNIFSLDDLLKWVPDNKYKTHVSFNEELKNKLYASCAKDILISMDFNGISKKMFSKIFLEIPYSEFIDLYVKDKSLLKEKLLNIKGIKDKIVKQLFYSLDLNMLNLMTIMSSTNYKGSKDTTDNQENASKILKGKSFCITGSLTRTRKEIEDLILLNGGEVKSNVNKNLTYLLTNDLNSSSSKFTKAKSLNIEIMTEQELINMLQK